MKGTLPTERLILREWRHSDLEDLVEGLNDLRVSRWLAFVPHPYTRADARKWIRTCSQRKPSLRARDSYEFGIELKSSGKVIGGVSVNRIQRLHGTAGGGIWLNAAYQGKGYGTEAFAERIRFAFEELKLRRLDNGFFRGNRASLRMLRRFGYKKEGVRREGLLCLADGRLKDEVTMGLLRDEWKRSLARRRPR